MSVDGIHRKLSKKTIKSMADAAKKGHVQGAICRKLGVSISTFHKWLADGRKHRELSDEERTKLTEYEQLCVEFVETYEQHVFKFEENITERVNISDDPKVLMNRLSRRNPQEYSGNYVRIDLDNLEQVLRSTKLKDEFVDKIFNMIREELDNAK